MRVRVMVVLIALEMLTGIAGAGEFSRSATTIQFMCVDAKCGPAVDVFSPDGKDEIRRTLDRSNKNRLNMEVEVPRLTVITPTGHSDILPDESRDPWIDLDVLWSPDSKFVALTGHTNSNIEYLRVFAITESGPREVDATVQPGQDMARRFRPYCDRYVGTMSCSLGAEDPNFAVIAWADSHTLVLMSEVPCDTLWGGIMCQVMGYEVELPSGRIIRAMTAREFKTRWQHSMAWNFTIPPRAPIPEQVKPN